MKDNISGMTKVDMKDLELAMYLKSKDPNWTWDSLSEFNRFIAKGEVVALVKYKNSYPCARWIWILEEDAKKFKKPETKKEKVDKLYALGVQCDMINGKLDHMSKEHIDDTWWIEDLDEIIQTAKQCIKSAWKVEMLRRRELFKTWDKDDLESIVWDCLRS